VLIDLILRIESFEIQIILKFRKGFKNKKISYFPYLFLGPKSPCAARSAHFLFFFSSPLSFPARSPLWISTRSTAPAHSTATQRSGLALVDSPACLAQLARSSSRRQQRPSRAPAPPLAVRHCRRTSHRPQLCPHAPVLAMDSMILRAPHRHLISSKEILNGRKMKKKTENQIHVKSATNSSRIFDLVQGIIRDVVLLVLGLLGLKKNFPNTPTTFPHRRAKLLPPSLRCRITTSRAPASGW
jgi:hypothetical protein